METNKIQEKISPKQNYSVPRFDHLYCDNDVALEWRVIPVCRLCEEELDWNLLQTSDQVIVLITEYQEYTIYPAMSVYSRILELFLDVIK